MMGISLYAVQWKNETKNFGNNGRFLERYPLWSTSLIFDRYESAMQFLRTDHSSIEPERSYYFLIRNWWILKSPKCTFLNAYTVHYYIRSDNFAWIDVRTKHLYSNFQRFNPISVQCTFDRCEKAWRHIDFTC